MPASPIRKLVPYADAAKAVGRHVHHLNIGQPDIRTPQVAIDAMRNLDLSVIEYSKSDGFQSYREGLSKYYAGHGIAIEPHQIMVTTGGSEALLFSMLSCMDPGDEIIIPEPLYANYNGFGQVAGIKVVPVTSTIESGFTLPPIEAFEAAITSRTRAILICNPGNPTGTLYGLEELMQLRELILKYDLWLFADEVYREFTYDGAKPFSVLNLDMLGEHVVLVDSVSKRYSMCGARIGALITRNREVMETALKFGQARLSPPTLAQIAAEAALDTPDAYFEEVTQEYVARRDLMVAGLNAIPGVVCPTPKGAFYCIAQLPVDNAEDFCQWMLEAFEYEGETVMMAPAAGFYATPGLGHNQVRIAYVLEQDALRRAVKCIELGLATYRSQA